MVILGVFLLLEGVPAVFFFFISPDCQSGHFVHCPRIVCGFRMSIPQHLMPALLFPCSALAANSASKNAPKIYFSAKTTVQNLHIPKIICTFAADLGNLSIPHSLLLRNQNQSILQVGMRAEPCSPRPCKIYKLVNNIYTTYYNVCLDI